MVTEKYIANFTFEDLKKFKLCPNCGEQEYVYTIGFFELISFECDRCGNHIKFGVDSPIEEYENIKKVDSNKNEEKLYAIKCGEKYVCFNSDGSMEFCDYSKSITSEKNLSELPLNIGLAEASGLIKLEEID